MPLDMVLGGGWRIEWAAVDPNTGADVSGVKVSVANVVGTSLSTTAAETPEQAAGPFMLIPGVNG